MSALPSPVRRSLRRPGLRRRAWQGLLWACVSTGCVAPAMAQIGSESDSLHPCGSLMNAYGPYDYRVYKGRIEVTRVEQYHFTPLVENLIKPMFQHLAADFDYTLRAIPNHHRALLSMARHSEKLKDPKPPGALRTVDCYFDRAMRFAPDDHIVRMIYAGHLVRVNRKTEALAQLDFVQTLVADNPLGQYNLGMSYLEAGAPDKALRQAHIAMAMGVQRQDLRNLLQKAGHWREPEAAAAPTSAPSASAPSAAAAPTAAASAASAASAQP